LVLRYVTNVNEWRINKPRHHLQSGLPSVSYPSPCYRSDSAIPLMADVDPLSYLFNALSFKRMSMVSFLPASVSCFAVLLKSSPEYQPSVPPLKMQLSPSNSCHSHGLCDIYLGLRPPVQRGGRSGLEIKVEFHERAVPLSTLPAIYQYHHSSLLSV